MNVEKDKQYNNGHINQPMNDYYIRLDSILLNQTITVFNLAVLENTGAEKDSCYYQGLAQTFWGAVAVAIWL